VFLVIVTGVLDLGRAVFQENTLNYAAREATRYLIVHGSKSSSPIGPCTSCTNTTVTNIVTAAAIGVPNITVTIDYPDLKNDRQNRVSVDATAPFVPLPSQYLIAGAFKVTLRGGSMLVIQR
jgi:hypothetical protein